MRRSIWTLNISPEKRVVAEAKIIHKGLTTAGGDVEIKDEKDEFVAKAIGNVCYNQRSMNA